MKQRYTSDWQLLAICHSKTTAHDSQRHRSALLAKKLRCALTVHRGQPPGPKRFGESDLNTALWPLRSDTKSGRGHLLQLKCRQFENPSVTGA
jgi:hypothetical protein